jgi:hypothetical protein
MQQASELGKITDRKYRGLCSQVCKLGYQKDEQEPIAPEQPTVLRDLLMVYKRDFGYDVEQLSRLARSSVSQFERLFLCEARPLARGPGLG